MSATLKTRLRNTRKWQNYAYSNSEIDRQISAFGRWVSDWMKEGREVHFVTFMFHQLPGSKESIIRQMTRDVETFFSRLNNRVDRHPRRVSHFERLPKFIGAPDLPVFKHNKDRLQDITINDGLHFAGAAALSPGHRLREPLPDHVAVYGERYRSGTQIRWIDATPITETPEKAMDYVLKTVRGRLDWDHLLILPKSLTE